MNPALLSSDRMDWETPQTFFDSLNAEFSFTLDVCATASNAKCAKYFSQNDNGLEQDWMQHVCWMNPPYGRAIKLWMQKAFKAAQRGAIVVCLVPARTDTAWWHDYAMKGEVRFLRGRIRFVGAKSSAPFPSALIVFRSILGHET